MTRPYPMRGILVAAIVFTLCHGASTFAATLHHWRFETAPGFLVDSAGGATLSGSATQTPLPLSGPGAMFAGLPGNASAADTTTGGLITTLTDAPSGDFTIELFAHANSTAAGNGAVLAGTLSSNANTNVDWVLQDRAGSVTLLACAGAACQFLSSGIPLIPGADHYVAAAFDLAGGNARFFVRDLSAEDPVQIVDVSHSMASFNRIDTFQTGATFGFDGLVDEIRLSDAVLNETDLLLSTWAAPVPLPPGRVADDIRARVLGGPTSGTACLRRLAKGGRKITATRITPARRDP